MNPKRLTWLLSPIILGSTILFSNSICSGDTQPVSSGTVTIPFNSDSSSSKNPYNSKSETSKKSETSPELKIPAEKPDVANEIEVSYTDVNNDGNLDQIIKHKDYRVVVINPGKLASGNSFDVLLRPTSGKSEIYLDQKKLETSRIAEKSDQRTSNNENLEKKAENNVRPKSKFNQLIKAVLYDSNIQEHGGYLEWESGYKINLVKVNNGNSAGRNKFVIKNIRVENDFNSDGYADALVEWINGYKTPLIRSDDEVEYKDINYIKQSPDGCFSGNCSNGNCPSKIFFDPESGFNQIPQASQKTSKIKIVNKVYLHGSRLSKINNEIDYAELEKNINSSRLVDIR